MKIFHVETGQHLYGGPKQVEHLIRNLKEMGIENTLYCPEGSDIAAACKDDAKVITAPSKGLLGAIRFTNGLSRALEKQSPDVIHVHSRRFGADFLAGMIARAQSIPAVLSRRVDNPEDRWSLRFKYPLYRHIITISDGIREVLTQQGVPAHTISTVRSAVDANAYQVGGDRDAFLQRFELPQDSLVIAVVAQLIHRKGHRHLLAILPQLIAQHPTLQVLLLGKGALADELQNAIDTQGLGSHVKLVGFIENLPDYLGNVDLLVHPADMEGLGVSLLQAAASGVPIVASRAGGMPEAVHHQVNGLLVSPGNTDELYHAVDSLLSDKALRTHYGQQGRVLIESQFSTQAMASGNLAIYRKVLEDAKT